MVTITVILAAVIGTFVLGLGDQVSESAPNANLQFDVVDEDTSSNPNIEINHRGGDALALGDDVEVRIGNLDEGSDNDFEVTTDDGPIRAGGTIEIDVTNTDVNGETVDVVFTSGDRDDIIGTFDIREDTFE